MTASLQSPQLEMEKARSGNSRRRQRVCFQRLAVVVWDDTLLIIPVDEADAEPLVGMSLMEGYQLTIQVSKGGQVELRKVTV